MNIIVLVLLTQVLYTSADLLARHFMGAYGFTVSNFLTPWFLVYFTLRTVAMFGQLYLLTFVELGRNASLFALASIMLANVLGYLFLGEVLTSTQYVGVMLAVAAFIVLAMR